MALSYADGDIGQNSLEMIPFEEQEFGDYCTGEILVSAVRAKADYQCTYPDSAAFSGLGPLVQSEVQNSVALAQQNIASQSAITQETIDAGSAPIISDAAIATAPNAKPVGSAGAESPFTTSQVNAANHDPINWPATLTVQAAMQKSTVFRRNQQLSRQAKRNASTVGPAAGATPFPVWGTPSASRQGWCASGGGTPWGKLLLFTGLGLIGASLLDRK